MVVFHPAVDGPARYAGQPGAFRHGRRGDEVWEGGDLSVGKGDRLVIGRLVCGVELLYICGIVRHLGTFSFGDYLKDCDMSATLRDIGATFSAITVTKCDAPTAPVCAPAARERGRGARGSGPGQAAAREWGRVSGGWHIARMCGSVKCLNCDFCDGMIRDDGGVGKLACLGGHDGCGAGFSAHAGSSSMGLPRNAGLRFLTSLALRSE